MNSVVILLALFCGLVMCCTGVSVYALVRAHALMREVSAHPRDSPSHCDGETQALRESVESLAARLRDFERHPPPSATPGLPRPGLNMTRRSQALRMHRQGESPEQIAAALELPRQEVDLLLKVHRIVISNI